jgi:hypothetical protein
MVVNAENSVIHEGLPPEVAGTGGGLRQCGGPGHSGTRPRHSGLLSMSLTPQSLRIVGRDYVRFMVGNRGAAGFRGVGGGPSMVV